MPSSSASNETKSHINEMKEKRYLDDGESTNSLTDSESDLGSSTRIEDFELSLLDASDHGSSRVEDEDERPVQRMKKSVRFAQVHLREYNVVDEMPSPLDHEDEAPRRSLGWNFIERQIDLETYMTESMRNRKEECARLIHEHIIRAEKEQEEKNKNDKIKRKGWKAKIKRVLKPVGHGFMEAATRTNFMLATTY